MKIKLLSIVSFIVLLSVSFSGKSQGFIENFDDITSLPSGWVMANNSVPVGTINWFQGNPVSNGGPFDAFNGATNAYIGANFNNTGATGTISNWLMTPDRTFVNGDVITFYTRKTDYNATPPDYPDRLEVRLSSNGASTAAGSGATVGDFTTLLLSINPSLITGVYPTAWTQYSITISGLSAPTSGRIAFRYFVTDAGSSGTNSDFIGIDNVVYTPYVCPTFTMTAAGALSGGTAGTAYSNTLTQTGALGTPTFAVTAGALPPGLTMSSSGTISGTPTATGTFNFTATVSDASGCTGSTSYSITVVCPVNPITFTSAPSLCDNGTSYTLVQGSPTGGTYSGTGVTGGNFDPSVGTQTITYDYTDAYGCAHNSNYTITVNTAPTVTQSAISAVCSNSATVVLSGGSPAGGSYSGTGVTGGNFDPSVGNQTITYSYTDANTCSNTATTTITVNTAPTVTQNAISATCDNAGSIVLSGGSPVGGSYSGTGVTSGNFDPSVGTQTITYSYTDGNNCSNTATTSITVNTAPTVTFNSPVSSLCTYNNAITLSGGNPAGGTYSGAGVSSGVMNPATAGAGTHTITYTYIDGNNCQGSAQSSILVDACLGIEIEENSVLSIYPNPANEELSIDFENTTANNAEIVLVSNDGKIVYSSIIKANSQFNQKINVIDFSDGIYFVKIKSESILIVQKVVLN